MKKYKWFNFTSERETAEYNLFCLPHAGAGASIYASWGKTIPDKYSFFPVQLPMRENRRKDILPAAIKDLGKIIADENAELFASKPFILFGHCFGALAAYETALALKKYYSCNPELLITSSVQSPRETKNAVDLNDMDHEEITEHFIKLGYITPEMVNIPAYLDCFIPALKEDCKLVHKYIPNEGEKVDCPIYVPFGADDPAVEISEAEKWRNFTEKTAIAEKYEGGHFFLNAKNFSSMLERAFMHKNISNIKD